MRSKAHWNYKPEAAYIREFFSHFRRKLETGKIETDQPSFRFDDVQNPDKYYCDPVYWAYSNDLQITKGTSDTAFSPNEEVTRGQAAAFLYKNIR